MSLINLTINGKAVAVEEGTNILEAAKKVNIKIPNLCYLHIDDIGFDNSCASCRVCLVNADGRLVPSCATLAKEGMKVAIVASRFNEIIVNKLLGGAVDGLVRHGVEENNITAAWVPGAFEIPVVAKKLACSKKYDAVICVGAVIRGDTSHYDYVCNEVSKGVAQVGLETGVPVLFGIVTTENIEQAIARAGSKAGNKGYDCALSAIEMVNLLEQIS